MGGLWVFGVGVFIVAPVVLIVIFLLIKASSDASAARREVDTLGRYVTQLRDSMRDLGSKDEVAKLSEKVRALEAALGSSEPDDSRFAPPLVDAPLAEPASKPAVELSEVDPEPQPEPVADAPKPAARKPVSMPETSSARAAEKYRKQAAEEMRKALRPREPVAPPPVAPEPPPVVPPDPEPEPKPEPPPVVQPEPKPEPVRPAASVAREPEPARPPSTPAPRKRKARKAIDWEALIGGKLALWAGSGLVLIAAAFGLAYGWKFIQPEGRVALGVVLGLGMVGAAELARKRTESWYPEGLTGAGVGVLYLSIWAAAIRYGLFADILLPFGLMAVVTAICAGMSVRHDSRALILLATLGGFATPFLLKSSHGGPDYAIRFWAYVTCLNGGILAVSAFRRWREMNLISFVATLVLLVSWFIGKYNDGLLWTVLPFLSVNFVLFVGIGSLYALRLRKVADWADVSLVALATVAYSTTALYMLPGDPRWHRAALAFILAAFFAGLLIETVRRLPNDKSLLYCNLGMGLAFLTIGFPLLVGGHPLAMAWAAEAAVLVALGFASKRPELRGAGLGVWGLAACYTVWVDARVTLPYDLALINERGALYLVLAGSAAATAWLYLKLSEADDDERSTAGVMTLASGIALCALTAREILGAFSHEAWFPAFHPHWRSAAWLCIWAAWAAIISVVYGVGLRSRLQFVYEIAMTALLGTGLATVVLGGSSVMYDWPGLLNPRFIAALVVAAALGCSGTLKRWARGTIESGTEMALAAASGVVAATGLAEEMWSIVAHGPLVGAIGWMPQAWFAAAMVAMACAVLYALIRLYGRAQAWHWTGSAVGGAAIVLMVCVSVLSFRAE